MSMAGGGAQSGKRKSNKKAPGHKACEVAEQVDYCHGRLIEYCSARNLEKELRERYGLDYHTAHNRIKCARERIREGVDRLDRRDLAALMHDRVEAIAAEAMRTRQLSNAIGANRLLGELAGFLGNNRVSL